MAKNATSFKPHQSGNPKGRPKGVRSLARLIDTLADEQCPGSEDTMRMAMARRLWTAAATGKLELGETSKTLKPEAWIDLVKWLVVHMDKVAIDQQTVHGQGQLCDENEGEGLGRWGEKAELGQADDELNEEEATYFDEEGETDEGAVEDVAAIADGEAMGEADEREADQEMGYADEVVAAVNAARATLLRGGGIWPEFRALPVGYSTSGTISEKSEERGT